MGDLRRRVAEKKAKGLYGVDALMAASTEDDGEPFGLEDLERLRNLAVQRVQIDTAASTKPLVGGAVSRIKRLLVRGASQPMYGMSAQATAFNGALLSYLSSLAREVSVLERQVRAEREQGDGLREEIAALREEVARAAEAMAEARAAVAHLADAALPERVARLERLGPAAPGEPAAAASPSGSLRLRLEATEDDAGREWRMAAYSGAFGDRRVLHLGAGSGRALEALGEGAEGVEGDGELAAAAAAAGRRVRHADPVAHLATLPPESVDAILVTDLVERLGGGGLTSLAAGIARALAPGGMAIVEGHHPNGVNEDLLFWRDPDRLRALHPDAVRMALEAAGLATTGVTLHPAAGRESGSSDEPQRYAVHAAR
ncbi:MAG: hypothetical protein JHC74_00090 [Thermoleophilia bacterium]|nr:hypothetical protein [Thermoleophilia bacterium]